MHARPYQANSPIDRQQKHHLSRTAMFDTYSEIFNARGTSYHQAMKLFPLARRQEFKTIAKMAQINTGHLVIDAPPGGCYLQKHIDDEATIISVETSRKFISEIESPYNNNTIIACDTLSNIPLPDESADRVISLAGLHHISNKKGFFQEAFRLLKPGGLFCIGDAREGSAVANFLDIFVNQMSSMGHHGLYLNETTEQQLTAADFSICSSSLTN